MTNGNMVTDTAVQSYETSFSNGYFPGHGRSTCYEAVFAYMRLMTQQCGRHNGNIVLDDAVLADDGTFGNQYILTYTGRRVDDCCRMDDCCHRHFTHETFIELLFQVEACISNADEYRIEHSILEHRLNVIVIAKHRNACYKRTFRSVAVEHSDHFYLRFSAKVCYLLSKITRAYEGCFCLPPLIFLSVDT